MDWLEVTVTTKSDEIAEILEAELADFVEGDEGVATEQLGDPDALDPGTLLPEIAVRLYVRCDRDTPELRAEIAAHLSVRKLPEPTFRGLKDEDWANAWKAHYHPTRVGRTILIQPSWIPLEPGVADEGLHVLELDPGVAFGTGTHETTQLCLRALEDTLRPGARVLDLGTGSGILAIAAVQMGAENVLAIDNDGMALRAALDNLKRNGVAPAVTGIEGSLADAGDGRYELVLANILEPILREMLSEGLLDRVADGGHLILSGILERQREAFEEEVAARGGRILIRETQGRWCGLVVERA